MKKEKRVVITGIGPLTAGGSGKREVWDAVINKRTGLIEKEYKIDGETLGKFFVHKIKNFDINNYGINQQILDEIRSWKMGDEITDLYYFLAVIKMAMDDAGLKINDKNKYNTGLILAH
ncbi:MAG: beta-ketoacyl synthase N-terminal-like domain-containing protein, partial [Candidatus Omnitrophota bacterium]